MYPKIIPILGSGKVAIGGTVPAIKFCLNAAPVIVTSHYGKFKGKEKKVVEKGVCSYKLIPYNPELLHSDEILKGDVVMYIDVNSTFFPDLIKNASCIFSSCREGLAFYQKRIDNIIRDTREMNVYVFDNDPRFVQAAVENAGYPNVKYKPAVIHATVTKMDMENESINIITGDCARLVLPPSATPEEIGLHRPPKLSPFLQKKDLNISIAKSEGEFRLSILSKCILLNAHHTYQSVLAVSKGLQQGESIEQIQEKPLEAYFSFKEVAQNAELLYEVTYADMLIQFAETDEYRQLKKTMLDSNVYFMKLVSFLTTIYYEKDAIKRGINVDNVPDAYSKYQRHILYLKEASDRLMDRNTAKRAVNMLRKAGFANYDEDMLNEACAFSRMVFEAAEVYRELEGL